MIGLGLRLALAGGREAVTRLVVIMVAVAIGGTMLLTTLAGVNAIGALESRYAWLNTKASTTAAAGTDSVLWLLREDYFHGNTIGRLDIGATGPAAPVPPGVPKLPGPGEYYVSPALADLLRSTPADQLGDRFPGHQIGTIGDAALPAPTSLLIIIGHRPDEMAGAGRVTAINTIDPGHCSGCEVGIRTAGLDLVLAVIVGAMLFPLAIFIGAATRLSAARREERFAAMRLVGATPRQVSTVAAVEAAIAAVAGVLLAFGLFAAVRRPVAAIPFTGAPFFPSDLSLNLTDALLVGIGAPVVAAVAALLALRRVQISPLGVSRRVTPPPPRAWRLVPLGLGLAELALMLVVRKPTTSTGQVAVFLPGFLVAMAGLVIAGPWLTMVGARLVARRTSRAATLIAARRLADNPKAGFRAVSGLILALFVTTVAVGVMTTINDHRGTRVTGPMANNLRQDTTTPLPEAMLAQLRATPGVQKVATVYEAPRDSLVPTTVRVRRGVAQNSAGWVLPNLVSCAEIADHPDFGRCAPGAQVASVEPGLYFSDDHPGPKDVWPTADFTVEQLSALPVSNIVVGTDGSPAAIERARTVLARANSGGRFASTEVDWRHDSARLLNQWQQLANVIVLVSLAIAGCSLAVSVAGGLTERKRPFSLLRLTGAPLGLLRRVVALESTVPLLLSAAVAIAAGLLGAHLFLRAQMQYSLRPLGITYVVTVLAGLAGSIAVIASTMPLLRRITGPETARNE